MPVTMPQNQVDQILAVLDADTATAYRAALAANGSQDEAGWVFQSSECLLRAHDLFYPEGRPKAPMPASQSYIDAAATRALPYESWPPYAKALGKLASRSDVGVGDTVARCLSYLGASTIADAYTIITGVDCGCADRQGRLNALYPYSQPDSA